MGKQLSRSFPAKWRCARDNAIASGLLNRDTTCVFCEAGDLSERALQRDPFWEPAPMRPAPFRFCMAIGNWADCFSSAVNAFVRTGPDNGKTDCSVQETCAREEYNADRAFGLEPSSVGKEYEISADFSAPETDETDS